MRLGTIPVTARRKERGIDRETIRAARKFPNRRSRTTTTMTAPSVRLLRTVAIVRSTKSARLDSMRISTPGGREVEISRIWASTFRATTLGFSPASIMTVPRRASRPFHVAAPTRTDEPVCTSATSDSRKAVTPGPVFTARVATSSGWFTRVLARTLTCSPPKERIPPPAFSVFSATTSRISRKERPAPASFSGEARTSNCLSFPPIVLISATPGTERSLGLIKRSWMRFSSMSCSDRSLGISGLWAPALKSTV